MVHQTLPDVVVYEDANRLAEQVALRLVERLITLQTLRGTASLVLTGGRTGIAVLERLGAASGRDRVDWSAVDIFWGDDRFVGSQHADRNELQARRALLDHLDLPTERVHPMAASDGAFGDDPDRAAEAYRRVLATHRRADEPLFDVCLLGIGEDGHVASLFPGLEAVDETALEAVAVRVSPKPPSTRITLTVPALRDSREIWLFATGSTKADALAQAIAGTDETSLPAARVQGVERTMWFVDSAAVGARTP